MASFIAAVHTRKGQPVAFALAEQRPGPRGARYAVRRLHRLGDDGLQHVLADLTADREATAHTTLVVSGGQPAADRFHDAGPSAVPVVLLGPDASAGADSLSVWTQTLVDTFERVYRDGDVEVPGVLDAASEAVDALYRGADLEAVAPDGEAYDDDGTTSAMSGDVYPGTPRPVTVEQSGGEANVSTGVIGRRRDSDATEMLGSETERPRRGRIAGSSGAAPDLGEAEDVAFALALAVWFGEYAADELLVTDQADEVR